MDTPLPVMRGRYCRRSRALNAAMQAADILLTVFRPLSLLPVKRKPPRRLLISNLAHLGDLVVATSLLPVLKSAFPDCEIGFLIGSWAIPVLAGHPLVDTVHILDHWMLNRAALPRREKIRRYFQTRRQALREVKAARYDAALDLSWSFPNTLPFLWQAKIPTRIGYSSGAFGPLATRCAGFDDRPLHAAARHLALAAMLPVSEADLACAVPVLPPAPASVRESLDRTLLAAGAAQAGFVVFHVSAGGNLKVWPVPKWRALAERWLQDGVQIVFTGAGEKDAARIAEITAGLAGCVSLCDRLSWSELVETITRARLLVCVDTVAGHIAGAVGTPCAVIMTGQNPYLWHPLGAKHRVLTAPVPCLPCHRGLGCAAMECIRNVEPEQVYEAGCALLSG